MGIQGTVPKHCSPYFKAVFHKSGCRFYCITKKTEIMTFKDIKKGHPVYMLHKGDDGLREEIGKVTAITQPRFPQYNGGGTALSTTVVDVTVETGGANNTYTIPADSSVVSAGNTILSVDREGILKEVDALETESDDIINSVAKHEARKKDCERIKEEWNPAFAEKKKQDERIGSLESGMNELKGLVRTLVDKLS